MNRQYEQQARRELEALTRARDIKRELDEAARYRAALEEIEVPSLDITDGDPRCNYCYHEHPEHSPFCPTGIAHRALHPEEGER